jgi:hypothetical protein
MNKTTKYNILAYASEPDKSYNYEGDIVDYKGKRYFVSLAEERVEFIGILTVKDLIKDKDYDYISWRIKLDERDRKKVGEDDIFFGCCRSEGGKLISLDGDTYSEREHVLSYEEWTKSDENGITNGLTVIVEEE